MKIGSKLAIKRLKIFTTKEGKKFYNATLVEATLNSKIMKGNKWEYNLYLANIYTDLELEEAKYDLELPEKKIEYFTPEGEKKEFFVKANKLDPARISNPDHSIIRVLDFEFKSTTVQENGKVKTNENGKIIFNHTLSIGKCEYDIGGWKLPDKKLELRVATVEKQKTELVNKYRQQIKELKEKLEKYQVEENANKTYFVINKVEFELECIEQFTENMDFTIDSKEYGKIKALNGEHMLVSCFTGKELLDSEVLEITIGEVDENNEYSLNLHKYIEK